MSVKLGSSVADGSIGLVGTEEVTLSNFLAEAQVLSRWVIRTGASGGCPG